MSGAPTPTAPRRARMPQRERRTQLLDVTLALLAQEGFERLSIEAIARRAGVNRVVVYRSFANLQVLLVALLHRERARVERQMDALIPTEPAGRHPRQLLLDALAGFLTAVEGDPMTWRVALSPPESVPVALRTVVAGRRAAVQRRIRPLIAWGLTELDAPPGTVDEPVVTRMLLSLGEEHGRLLLEGEDFPRARLLSAAERTLNALRWRETS